MSDTMPSPELDDERVDEPSEPKSRFHLNWVAESLLIFGIGVLIALLGRQFLVQAYEIPSSSMVDTLLIGDRVVVNKKSYGDGEVPERGDIVVFKRPDVPECVFDPADPKDLIKRVIGLPGEIVSGQGGEIFVNGKRLNEPWFVETKQSRDFADIEVPEGQVLLLGDNRLNSKDGTCFGPVSVDTIVGRAFFRIWPVGRLGSL